MGPSAALSRRPPALGSSRSAHCPGSTEIMHHMFNTNKDIMICYR